MGDSFQELTTPHNKPATSMKCFVPLSLLLVSMAKGQDAGFDAASLNAILPDGFTKVCEDGEEPVSADQPRGKRQVGEGPPPCWSLVDSDFPRADCNDNNFGADNGAIAKCSKEKPYVGKNQNHMCIFFPQAGKWFKLSGTYGWCGADNCCDFHPKNQCNPQGLWLLSFDYPLNMLPVTKFLIKMIFLLLE